MTAKNNFLTFYTTTPDIAFGIGLDRSADLKFSLSFDITCTTRIGLSGDLRGHNEGIWPDWYDVLPKAEE